MESLIGSKVNFAELDSSFESNLPPTPLDLPKNQVTRESLSFDLTKSATLDAVLSQNEDLMNRLKVALKRLAQLETENQRMSDETSRFRLTFSSVKTQVEVYKEEALEWKTQVQEKEREIKTLIEIKNALTEKQNRQDQEILRFQKYQEKIKSEVRPFIADLKHQNKSLSEKNQELEQLISKKDSQLSQIREQIQNLASQSKSQIAILEKNLHETTEAYEDQMDQVHKELEQRRSQVLDLEDQVHRLSKRSEKMDLVENELISQKRIYNEVTFTLKSEVERLQSEVHTKDKENKELDLEIEKLKAELQSIQNQWLESENRKRTQSEQLDQMRLMWNEKCEEIEKIKKMMNALERLNIELSNQLQRDRQLRS